VEHLARRYGACPAPDPAHAGDWCGEWKLRQKFLSETCEGRIGGVGVLFVRPQTFMNRSGEAIHKLVGFYKLDPTFQLLILSDDCDLSLGEVRFRASGGPGTHNGLKSIVEQIGEGFPRIRIGLGAPPPMQDLAAWALSVPPPGEGERLEEAIQREVPRRVEEFAGGTQRAARPSR
jgi:PTH1 family peptidyl-tRNA hydrolase